MNRLHKILWTLFAIFAFCVIFAASASAETTLLAEWLVSGTSIPGGLHYGTEIKGAFLFEDTETLAGAMDIICRFTFDGTITANGEGSITGISNVSNEKVEALGGLALRGTGAVSGAGSECVGEKTCAAGNEASPIEVWPIGLPWSTSLFLMTEAILDLISSTSGVGFEVLCLVLGLNVEDKCEAVDVEFGVMNDPTTLDAEIPANAAIVPSLNCTQSKKATGIIETVELVFVTQNIGELLTVSSE